MKHVKNQMLSQAPLSLLTASRTLLTGLGLHARSLVTSIPRPGDGETRHVTLIPGDGIGPEVAKAVEDVVEELKAPIIWDKFEISGTGHDGEPRTELPRVLMDNIRKNRVCLKGTLLTPTDATNMSLNLLLRKELDLGMNIVHAVHIPGVTTRHDDLGLDIVVVRENTEGEYSGLEHETVPGVVESLKVITYDSSFRTAQYAFEFAMLNNRKKITAVHKANIMKAGDGMFLKAVRKVAEKYPHIKYEEMIVDNTCMQLASKPEQFDVMVTPNLYGNLVANIAAGLVGGYGVTPGANVGADCAVFEQGARHVAKNSAGKGISNPTATLLSTSMMLKHLRFHSFADRLEKSVLKVYKDGDKSVLTPDVGGTGTLHTFSEAVMKNL